MNCELCGDLIHPDRLEILPTTTSCINCSDLVTDPIVGFMIYTHKTAGEVIMTSGKENVLILEREYNRAR